MPLYFLSAITGDVVALSSIAPPFYSVKVHLQVRNPLPQQVRVKKLRLTAHHLSFQGPTLYEYDRVIKEPEFNPSYYVLNGMEQVVVDFPLHVLSEVSWSFLLSPQEIWELIEEGASQKVTVGVDLLVTLEINDGFLQEVRYKNDALSGILCFHATEPQESCGGLPPMTPHGSRWSLGPSQRAAHSLIRNTSRLIV